MSLQKLVRPLLADVLGERHSQEQRAAYQDEEDGEHWEAKDEEELALHGRKSTALYSRMNNACWKARP
jgi:hypothetical protein